MKQQLFPGTLMPDRDWWQALWPDPDATVLSLGLRPGMSVVDLCCGDGYFTAAMARQVGTGRVIGFDLDPNLLNQAKEACGGATNCSWILGDARELRQLVTTKTDLVLMANTLHGISDQVAMAREIAAVLKPGGRFVIVNWLVKPRQETTVLGQPRGPLTEKRMSPEAVRDVVEPAGFMLESVVELPPYHYGAVFVWQGEVQSTSAFQDCQE